jgi:hypothetical protein
MKTPDTQGSKYCTWWFSKNFQLVEMVHARKSKSGNPLDGAPEAPRAWIQALVWDTCQKPNGRLSLSDRAAICNRLAVPDRWKARRVACSDEKAPWQGHGAAFWKQAF